MGTNCEFNGIVDDLYEQVKNINIDFQVKTTNLLNTDPNTKEFENLKFADEYRSLLDLINNNIQEFSNKVESCIKKYKFLTENSQIQSKPETNTSNVMYNESLMIEKVNMYDRIQMIIGNILVCYFFYHLYKNKV